MKQADKIITALKQAQSNLERCAFGVLSGNCSKSDYDAAHQVWVTIVKQAENLHLHSRVKHA
jgi:hypothetical protein